MCSSFVHLNNHSHFSLLRGVPSPQEWVQQALLLGFKALALTDTNQTGGLILFLEECKRHSILPILGVHLMNEHHPQDSFTLLARNMAGYADLCEITSQYMLHHRHQYHQEDFKMSRLLETTSMKDLVVMSHSPETLRDLASAYAKRWRDEGVMFYGELIAQSPSSRKRSLQVVAIAEEYQIPLVATNANHFLDSQGHTLHRVLRAIDNNSSLEQLHPEDVCPPGAYMKSAELMREIFQRQPEAYTNAGVIAAAIEDDWTQQDWLMPKIEVPEGFSDDEYLKHCALQGLDDNYPAQSEPRYQESRHQESRYQEPRYQEVRELAMSHRPQALEIQHRELEIICQKGYSSYFLMVKQIRDWANQHFSESYRRPRDCSVLRGSAANSITLYNLGASDLDPIRYGLYFERFLNEDRVSPPDADLDFGWDERDQVLDYIIEHFGEERCAMMCTTNTFRWRSAFREVAKVFGYTDDQITRLMKEWKSESRDAQADRKRGDTQLRQILDLASQIEGKPRFLGQHPGGILISNQPITRHVSCQYSGGVKNRKITQIDMHNGIDYLGLIKFDILGNGSLSVLRDALRNIEDQGFEDPEVWDLEKCYVDPGVQEILSTAQSRGIFYVESPAQMRLNLKCDAKTFEEIGITSSLVRPASAAFTQTFIERHRAYKRGVQEWSFLHPSLSGVLGDTHDVAVYQEDVIRICVEIAGMSFAQADRVRKMMNSMHEGEPENYAETARQFQEGCQRHQGFSPAQAVELWARIASFQGFSFCQSHSMSYAQLSFKCSYLKAHYGPEFMAAVISNDHGFYGTSIYIDEVRRMGIEVLPPCVQMSEWKYRGLRDGASELLRVGLMHIRGVRRVHVDEMIRERSRGAWLGFYDFLERNPQMGRREVEALIQVSAFDCFGQSQTQLMAELHTWCKSKTGSLLVSGQAELSQDLLQGMGVRSTIPPLPEISFAEKCYHELELLGYITSGHYLKMLALHPAADGTVAMADLGQFLYQRVKLFGSPMTFRRHRVHKSGQEMLFITMQDLSGTSDLVVWPRIYERFYTQTLDRVPLEIWGIPKMEDGAITFEVDSMRVARWNPGQVSFLRSVEMKKRQVYASQQMGALAQMALSA